MDNAEILIKFKADDSDAQEKTKTFGDRLKNAAKVGGAAMAAVGTAIVTTAKKTMDAIEATAQYGDEIDKNSQKVGFSTKAYQQWDYAMQISGSSMADCTMGLKTMTNKLDDFKNGSSSATEMFEKLGISLEDVQDKSREDVFSMAVAGLQNIEDAAEKAAIANDLFGRSGQELMPMFNQTNEETQRLLDEAERYGMVIGEDAVKASADFQDSITKLKKTAGGLAKGLVSEFMPGISTLANGFSDMVAGVDGADEKVQEGITQIGDALTNTLPKIAENVAKFAPMIVDVAVELIKAVAEVFSDGETVMNIIDALINGLIECIPTILEASVLIATNLAIGLVKATPKILAVIPQIVVSILSGFVKGLAGMFGIGGDAIKGLWNGISDKLGWILNKIKGFGSAIINGIKGIFGIHSPSRVMADQVGQYLPKGMAVGIEANTDSVYNAIGDIQDGINSTFGIGNIGGFSSNLSPNIITNVDVHAETDPLGQTVQKIRTFSGGSKNDYNYGYGGA